MINNATFWLILLILMNVVWAGSHAVVKFGLGSADPLNLVFWRYFVAVPVLFLWIIVKKISFKFSKKDILRVVIAGICTGLTQVLWVFGLNMSQATDSSLLYVFEPVWGIILANIFLKEKILKTTIIGALIAIFGLIYLSEITSGKVFLTKQTLAIGNLFIIVSLLTEGFFSVIINPVAKKHDSKPVITLALFSAMIVVAIPLIFTTGIRFPESRNFIFPIFYLSILCSVIGYTMWVEVMKHIPVSIMLFTIFIQPIAGPFIAMIFLNEKIGVRTIVGGFLLLIGTFTAIVGYVLKSRKINTKESALITTNPSNPVI